MKKNIILNELKEILKESIRLYESNNKGAYESGRIDGVKWCIKIIEDLK